MTLYEGWGDIVGAVLATFLVTFLAVLFSVAVNRIPQTESHQKRRYLILTAAMGVGALARWLYVFTGTSVLYYGMLGVGTLLLGGLSMASDCRATPPGGDGKVTSGIAAISSRRRNSGGKWTLIDVIPGKCGATAPVAPKDVSTYSKMDAVAYVIYADDLASRTKGKRP